MRIDNRAQKVGHHRLSCALLTLHGKNGVWASPFEKLQQPRDGEDVIIIVTYIDVVAKLINVALLMGLK